MKTSKTLSANPVDWKAVEQGKREKNLAHLLIIAHDKGVPAAMEEWDRLLAEKRAKAHRSPDEKDAA